MKKRLLGIALVAGLFVGSLSAASKPQALPEFTGAGAENAVVVGTKGLTLWALAGGIGQFCLLDICNKTNEYNIPLKIYKLKKEGGKWEELGSVTLGAPCEITEFDTDKFGKKEKAYKYFAIVPQNGKKYNITINEDFKSYFAYSNTWLVINVAPVDPDADLSYQKNATVIHVPDLYKENPDEIFKDNIKIINHTSTKDIAVRIYGFGENYEMPKGTTKRIREQFFGADDGGADKVKESQRIWVYGWNVESKAWNPICLARTTDVEVEPDFHPRDYGWGPAFHENIALVFEDGKNYTVKAHVEHDDLYIELTD